jgi:DHA1 family tetracycline resistance protein-like MFS transporter
MMLGPLLMVVGMFLMPLIPSIVVFLASITMISFGSGIMRTIVPSFISKRGSVNERGGILGVTQSVASIAQIPGPLMGGFIFEAAGLAAPFFLSTALGAFAFALGCRVFQTCGRMGFKANTQLS